jgi:hypothetical protein
MKKALHTTLRFLLVFAIFLGLQSRVLMRYAEIFHKNHKSELVHSGINKVKAGIVHCKLQCYTQHFQTLNTPEKAFFCTLDEPFLISKQLYFHLHENLSFTPPIRLLPLRAPPVL